jgi:hypothetical protein
VDHLPITFVILLLVFGAPVAAALPVPLAIAGVTASLAGLYFLSGLTPVTYCLEGPNAALGQLPPEVVPDRGLAHLIRVELLHR